MPAVDFGLSLPNFGAGASRDGIDAAAAAAERAGWTSVWVTDHVLVGADGAADYGRIFEALVTLAWVAGRHERLRLGTSVVVAPQRNAVVLAKELASLDALSGGRLVAGVGVGWNAHEFANLGVAERFHARGTYLDETIALWRHLWAGSGAPFRGGHHVLEDYVFGPLPAQGANVPIWVGGHSPAALRRAGRLGDGYHSSAASPARYEERIPHVRAAAASAGRPMPVLSARVRVRLDEQTGPGYALRGSPDAAADEVRAWRALGVSTLVLAFPSAGPEGIAAEVERFAREVAPLV